MARGRFVGKILEQGWELNRAAGCFAREQRALVEPRFLEGLEVGGKAGTRVVRFPN